MFFFFPLKRASKSDDLIRTDHGCWVPDIAMAFIIDLLGIEKANCRTVLVSYCRFQLFKKVVICKFTDMVSKPSSEVSPSGRLR